MIRSGLSWTDRMHSFRIMAAILLLSFGTLLAGCGSGGGGDVVPGGGGGSSTLIPSFAPAQGNPQPDMVTMSSVVALGDELTVAVNVTETDDIASVSLDVTFDPAYLEFVEASCGELLPPCGSGTGSGTLFVLNDVGGRLVIGMAQTGSSSDAFGTEALLRLTFRALRQGASPLAFDSGQSALLDANLSDISGITWYGGTVVVD